MHPDASFTHIANVTSFGMMAGPLMDAAFYVELGARAVETVERMKRWGAYCQTFPGLKIKSSRVVCTAKILFE